MLKHASLLHWMEKLKETAKGRRYDTQLFSISMRKNQPTKSANCSRYIKGDICFRACIPINLFLKIFSEFSLFSDNKPSKRLSTANQVWKNHCCLSDSHLPAVKKKLLGCRSNLLETMPIRSLFCFQFYIRVINQLSSHSINTFSRRQFARRENQQNQAQ